MREHNPNRDELTLEDLSELDLSDIVYVKSVTSEEVKAADVEGTESLPDGIMLYAVHTADGTPVALLDNRDTAFAAARQYSMEPMSVH